MHRDVLRTSFLLLLPQSEKLAPFRTNSVMNNVVAFVGGGDVVV